MLSNRMMQKSFFVMMPTEFGNHLATSVQAPIKAMNNFFIRQYVLLTCRVTFLAQMYKFQSANIIDYQI